MSTTVDRPIPHSILHANARTTCALSLASSASFFLASSALAASFAANLSIFFGLLLLFSPSPPSPSADDADAAPGLGARAGGCSGGCCGSAPAKVGATVGGGSGSFLGRSEPRGGATRRPRSPGVGPLAPASGPLPSSSLPLEERRFSFFFCLFDCLFWVDVDG